MADIFGASRVTTPIGQIAGSEFARIYMGSLVALGQTFQAQFSRPSRPIMSIGDPQVYYVPGVGSGSVNMGRLVGADGFLALLNSGMGACGTIQSLMLSAGGGRCLVAPTQTLNFGGAMLEGVAIGLQAGNPEITETYNARISSLEKVGT